MGPTRGVVGHSGMRGSDAVGTFDILEELTWAWTVLFRNALDLDVVEVVLHDGKLVFVVQQVVAFATVEFENAHKYLQIQIRVVLEQVVHYIFLQSLHRMGFPRTGLTVCKASHYSVFKNKLDCWLQNKVVNFIRVLVFVEGVVESKRMIFYKLRYPIHFKFRLMHQYHRIGCANCIHNSSCHFLLEQRPFSYANWEFGGCTKLVFL